MCKLVRPNSFNGLLHNCIFRIFGDVAQEVFKQGLQANLVIRERDSLVMPPVTAGNFTHPFGNFHSSKAGSLLMLREELQDEHSKTKLSS